jgi:hypothetical protein
MEALATTDLDFLMGFVTQLASASGGEVDEARLNFIARDRQRRQAHQKRQHIIESVYRDAVATEDDMRQNEDKITGGRDADPRSTAEPADQSDDLTRSFVHLTNLPTYPLDRLSRYEATLWRQACQILFTLRCLNQRKPWERPRLR